MFTSEAYTLKNITTIDGHIITAGKLVVKSQYLCYMQVDTNWYWNKHPQQNVITAKTRTILNPQLKVNTITDIHYIPKILCNRTQEKNPYQDILYVLLILTKITSWKKLFAKTKIIFKDKLKFIAMMKKIYMIISNEYYMYLLYIYILTLIRYFNFLIRCQFDAFKYLYSFEMII